MSTPNTLAANKPQSSNSDSASVKPAFSGRKPKKFDKKKAVKFELVHKSQNDPSIHDPDASPYELKAVLNANEVKRLKKKGIEPVVPAVPKLLNVTGKSGVMKDVYNESDEDDEDEYGDFDDAQFEDAEEGEGDEYDEADARFADADEDEEDDDDLPGLEQLEISHTPAAAPSKATASTSKSPASTEPYPPRSADSQHPEGTWYNKWELELGEYGIPTDGYNYLKHFRPPGTGKFMAATNLPPNTDIREEFFGIYNEIDEENKHLAISKGIEKIDQDVKELLVKDEVEEFEELEDNFVELALGAADESELPCIDNVLEVKEGKKKVINTPVRPYRIPILPRDLDEEGEEGDEYEEYSEEGYEDEDERQPTLLDEQFEKALEEWDDDEIGALDDQEIKGGADIQQFQGVLDNFLLATKENFLPLPPAEKPARIPRYTSDEEKEVIEVEADSGEEWDCESIVSTYSNTENHPSMIVEKIPNKNKIKLSAKTGLPLGVLPSKEPKQKQAQDNLGKKREKGESIEVKRARKLALKAEKQVKRQQKKELRMAYKQEETKQITLMSNPMVAVSVLKY
jgi:protein LTV1